MLAYNSRFVKPRYKRSECPECGNSGLIVIKQATKECAGQLALCTACEVEEDDDQT